MNGRNGRLAPDHELVVYSHVWKKIDIALKKNQLIRCGVIIKIHYKEIQFGTVKRLWLVALI